MSSKTALERIAVTIRASRWLDDNASLDEHCRDISAQVDSLIGEPFGLRSPSASSKRLAQSRSDLGVVDKLLKKEITETKNQPHLRDLALSFDLLAKSIEHCRVAELQSNKPARPALIRSVSDRCFSDEHLCEILKLQCQSTRSASDRRNLEGCLNQLLAYSCMAFKNATSKQSEVDMTLLIDLKAICQADVESSRPSTPIRSAFGRTFMPNESTNRLLSRIACIIDYVERHQAEQGKVKAGIKELSKLKGKHFM